MKLKAGFLLTKLTNSKEKNEWLKSSYFNIKHISIELNDSIIRGPDIGDLLGVGSVLVTLYWNSALRWVVYHLQELFSPGKVPDVNASKIQKIKRHDKYSFVISSSCKVDLF